MVCGTGFKAHVPNATSTIRFGYCRAFARLGIGYRLVTVSDLATELERVSRPFVFLSIFDYETLSRAAIKALRGVPHFVWIAPSRRAMAIAYRQYGVRAESIDLPADYTTCRVQESGANFVFAPCPTSAYEYFEQWHNIGIPFESLLQACDDERYFPEPGNTQFVGVEMAFVGGYWRNKAFQFDKYLKPYEGRLTVFGHSPWPYRGYGGLLPEDDERVLYQNAKLCPAISEPHAEITGDIVERVFKVAGSGGVAITDAIKYYREVFSPEEVLFPENLDHYHALVKRALTDEDFNAKYRRAGIKAVRERHTYVHRARKVLDLLGLPAPGVVDGTKPESDLQQADR